VRRRDGRTPPGAYDAALAWLYAIEARRGIELGLERMRRAAAALGHPERAMPSFHVAGTNGKGSTAAMIAAVLTAAGRRVGLYTSPHLVSFRERIVMAGTPITEDEVVEGLAHIRRTLGDAHELTCFEVMTLLAWHTFASHAVEVTVLEVGLGGRLDATNLVVPEVSVITNVGRDHEQYLGHEITEIAAEKAGIIKPGVPVVTAATGAAATVIEARARELASPLDQWPRDFTLEGDRDDSLTYRSSTASIRRLTLSLAGDHQRRNAALALRALERAPVFGLDAAAARRGLAEVVWPGRLQMVRREPLVLLDGAHNPPGVENVVEEVRRLAAGRPVRVLFGVMRDKAWQTMLETVSGIASEIVLTAPRQARRADPAVLAATLGRAGVSVVPDPAVAYHDLVARSAAGDVILVTGSLFLVGDVLAAIDPALAAEAAREQAAARVADRP
jgi:dihydrofolate synthase/folylpolyglutamate synthase